MMRDREKAQEIILEIIKQAGGQVVGKTKLHKAFYIAHLIYAKDHYSSLEELSHWPIVHLPNGPGIDDGDELICDLEKKGAIEIVVSKTSSFRTTPTLMNRMFSVPTCWSTSAIARGVSIISWTASL